MSIYKSYLWLRKNGDNQITQEQHIRGRISSSSRGTVIREEGMFLEGGELIEVKKHVYKGNTYAIVVERDTDDDEINRIIDSVGLQPVN